MIVDKKAFSRYYSSLFNHAALLTFLAEQRLTLHTFLEDVRRMRNKVLAHHPLTEVECQLLDLYTEQITTPVQHAYEQGRTRVNPASLMAADGSEIQRYWTLAQEYAHAWGVDGKPIADNIERLSHKARERSDTRERIAAAVLWGAVAVTVLGMALGGISLLTSEPTRRPYVEPSLPLSVVEAESTPAASPRDLLARRGILWDRNALRAAIDRNDLEVTTLFLRGGMTWQLAWTDSAMAARHEEVLNLLLRYHLQMDELKPCRRFINTLTLEMSRGAQLSAIRKSYLQTFCTTPAVVARQRLAVDNAQQRTKTTGDAESKKWLAIQKSVYDVIR